MDEAILSSNSADEIGEKTIIGVTDVGAAMQRFGFIDYIMFLLMLFVCILIGLFFGFYSKAKTPQDYLMGNRSMKILPIALSLLAR